MPWVLLFCFFCFLIKIFSVGFSVFLIDVGVCYILLFRFLRSLIW